MKDHNRARGSACALRGRQPWQGRQRFVRVDSRAGSDWEVEACENRALMYQGSTPRRNLGAGSQTTCLRAHGWLLDFLSQYLFREIKSN